MHCRAVLAAIEQESPDALWCLGDTVGYGARPNECCALVRDAAEVCLAGNHDLLALDAVVLEGDFNADAGAAGRWTKDVLDEPSRAFIGGLEPQARLERAELFHASARDPVWEYVLGGESALATLELTKAPLVLVGHSHVPVRRRTRGRRALRRPCAGRHRDRPLTRPPALQSGLGRAAAGRRRARSLAAPRSRAGSCVVQACRRTTCRRRRLRFARQASRHRSPSGSRTGSR